MADNLEQRLRAVEDVLSIQRLLTDYGRTLDERDSTAFAALFAQDGAWIAPPDFHTEGPEAIRAMIDRMLAKVLPSARAHYITNLSIDLDGDRARAHSRFVLIEPLADGSPHIRLSGHYDDELVREGAQWRFRRRRLTPDLRWQDNAGKE